jgi:cytidine deaminase
MTGQEIQKLIQSAIATAHHSYSPYSRFRVGSSVLTQSGRIFSGTNVENRSYGGTICAERSAICQAVSHGDHQLKAVCVTGLDYDGYLPPCGICRQFIGEFGSDITVILAKNENDYKILTIRELLPFDSLSELKERP